MERVFNFSAGPATLPLSVLERAKEEMTNYQNTGMSIMEISHRTSVFDKVINEAENDLRTLMGIPDNYTVLFLQGGASLQFAMIPMNLLKDNESADYINSGSFSQKAIDEANQIKSINVIASSKEEGYTFVPKEYSINENSKYLHITYNNTIEGSRFTNLPKTNIPIVADMSSCILSEKMNVSDYGIIYAGAQKNLGPAGVTVVIIRNDLISDSLNIPKILRYKTHADKGSMFNTPSTYSIYMMGLVLKWLKEKGGVEVMEKENIQKSSMLYEYIDQSSFYKTKICKDDRSIMNVTFETGDSVLDDEFSKGATLNGITSIKGHRSVGGMRASMYNAMPIEGVSRLIEYMKEFEKKN